MIDLGYSKNKTDYLIILAKKVNLVKTVNKNKPPKAELVG